MTKLVLFLLSLLLVDCNAIDGDYFGIKNSTDAEIHLVFNIGCYDIKRVEPYGEIFGNGHIFQQGEKIILSSGETLFLDYLRIEDKSKWKEGSVGFKILESDSEELFKFKEFRNIVVDLGTYKCAPIWINEEDALLVHMGPSKVCDVVCEITRPNTGQSSLQNSISSQK